MHALPTGLRRYLMLLHLMCATVLVCQVAPSVRHGLPAHPDYRMAVAVVLFIALTYLAEHTNLQVKDSIWHNLATAAHVGALLLFATPVPMVIALVAATLSQARNHQSTLAQRAFNVTHPTLSVGLTGLLCSPLFQPSGLLHSGFLEAVPGLILVVALFYLFDVSMMLGLLALLGNRSPWHVWWQTYRHTLLPELAAGSFGILGAIVWAYAPPALALLVLPVAALQIAFRASVQADDRAQALRHRSQQLETVLAVGHHLRLQQSSAALLQAVTEAARNIVEAETVTGYIRDEEDPSQLRRLALDPPDAANPGAAHLGLAGCADCASADELRVPIATDGATIAGLLLIAGIPNAISAADRDLLAILTTQAAIALQNAHLHERALALAAHDSLTNLLNRRAMQARLEAEVARAIRGEHILCLLMIDLDDFSVINNNYGHHVGDAALRAVAQVLRTSVREMDVAARYGGDEFVALLPETTLEQGLAGAERLREAIAALRVIEGPVSLALTGSIGVAALPQHGSTAEDLLRAADQAAYAAKYAGKGCVARPEDAILALDRDPQELAEQLAHANMATVTALAAAVDAKDPYTQGHSQRVSCYAAALAEGVGLPAVDVARIRLAGQLHDVGKIGIPDAILSKPGKLTAEEYETIKQHPEIGERMLAGVPFLQEILPAVRHHHERWDGQGYPDGLCGSAIPPDAAILAVADTFDAMTSSRTYRVALPQAEARRRIMEASGSQFDPRVVHAFERSFLAGTFSVVAEPWSSTHRETIEQAS